MTTANVVRLGIAALVLGAAWSAVSRREAAVLRADVTDPTEDTDGDFLPDVVEWACMTNAQNPDTDFDGIPDFVEVVQRGNPRKASAPLPADQEMRVVVTSNLQPDGTHVVCLHLLFRFMGDASLLSSLQTWIQLGTAPGIQFSLDMLSSNITVAQRMTEEQGLWVRVTAPLASEDVLRCLLPCTIGADATIGSRAIHTAMPLFNVSGSTASLVPYDQDSYAIQSIGMSGAFVGGGSNRVCVLRLREMQAVPGGTAYMVTNAYCDDCNDLECSAACPLTEGWIFVLPGGLGAISGG
jgi:hypothetical protein